MEELAPREAVCFSLQVDNPPPPPPPAPFEKGSKTENGRVASLECVPQCEVRPNYSM